MERSILFYFLLSAIWWHGSATNTCSITNNISNCRYTVVCIIYAGSASNPNCNGMPYVTFEMESSPAHSLAAGLFGATNFDSRVRVFNGYNNSWVSVEESALRYYGNVLHVNLSRNELTSIKSNAFKNLMVLESLNVSHNFIVDVYSDWIKFTDGGVPHLNVLDLSYNLLSEISWWHFQSLSSLQKLYLQSNKISVLADDCFSSLKNLTHLYINNNRLHSINMTLINLKSLTNLDLSNNYLRNLSGYEMNRLVALEYINASYNSIEFVESNCFNPAFNLKSVDLRYNKIQSVIENVMFINNVKLMYLNLFNNNITLIQENSFKHNNLTFLNLEHNNLSSDVSENMFSGLKNITDLQLYHQSIKDIKTNAFSDMTSLTRLNLSTNNIASIDNSSFVKADLLNVLDLSHNQLSDVSFLKNCLFKLTELYVNNNNLNILRTDTFVDQNLLIKLDISNNKIIAIEPYSLPLNNLQYLYLTGNMLSGVIKSNVYSPAKFLRYLDLSHFNFSLVENMAFIDLPVLTRLNLSNNIIQSIGPNNFMGVENMYSLDISFNNLTNLVLNYSASSSLKAMYLNNNQLSNISGILPNNSDIIYLDLSYNNISELPDSILPSMKNLRALHLSHNKIQVFNNKSADTLSKLTDLSLSSNKLQFINLSHFAELISLDISNNTINFINISFFQGLDSLQSLDLSSNNIFMIVPGTFQYLNSLKLLNLSSNNLFNLRYGTFKGLNRTEALDISRNNIANVDVDVFHECYELHRLIIDYNRIKSLNVERLIQTVPKLSSLSIGGNPVGCKEIVHNIRNINRTFARTVEVTSIDKIYHEDNVYGIKCGDTDFLSTTVRSESNTNNNKESSNLMTILLCVFVLTLIGVIIGLFVYMNPRRYNVLERFNSRFDSTLNSSRSITESRDFYNSDSAI